MRRKENSYEKIQSFNQGDDIRPSHNVAALQPDGGSHCGQNQGLGGWASGGRGGWRSERVEFL
jgi:hypothetical protein